MGYHPPVRPPLDDSTVLVTGASAGIGREIARQLAARARALVLVARRAERLRGLAAELAAAHPRLRVQVAACDLADRTAVDAMLGEVEREVGGVDVLVNNAGAPVPMPYEEMTPNDWQQVLGYKLVGYVSCATQVLPSMRERGGGRIINVVGSAGREPNPWTTSTGIVNAALLNFTKTLSSQVACDRILVNAVSPGPIGTARWNALATNRPDEAAAVIEEIPVGRIGRPEDVAGLIVFLASTHASFITGASVTVDGGRCRSVAF